MKDNNTIFKPFTLDDIKNRKLILSMLKYEDSIIHGDLGKQIYNNDSYEHFTSLEAMLSIHRIVLNHYNFSTTDSDIANYRKIFSYYYNSPESYDKEIINAVTYMRENKCVFYKGPDFNVGSKFENVEVSDLSGNPVQLIDKLKNSKDDYTFIGGFSNS